MAARRSFLGAAAVATKVAQAAMTTAVMTVVATMVAAVVANRPVKVRFLKSTS